MEYSKKLHGIFLLIAILFVIGSIFSYDGLTLVSNYLLIPTLIFYYRLKSGNWFPFMVAALVFFYVRDIFLIYGFDHFPWLIIGSFFLGLLIIYVFALTGFKTSKMHVVEGISLLILYTFLAFLFITVSGLVPQALPDYETITYLYQFLLILLLGVTFTGYLLKSHYASLWLMLASASLLVSEISLFFKMHVVSDISVNIFYPLFHVMAYYALIQHALHRRRSLQTPYF
ncbi:hypothetical protein [Salinimicrobium gaetbulicola]|uniref:YhhN-like protein n=1 Tax=Salinimicrobium gaetbulicola TaxID=999702 RepID=A0ABW3IER2_9FLAO